MYIHTTLLCKNSSETKKITKKITSHQSTQTEFYFFLWILIISFIPFLWKELILHYTSISTYTLSNNILLNTLKMTLSEAWVDFIAGWASGAASVLAMQPVDTMLTRFQAASSSSYTSTAIVQQQTRGLVSSAGFQALWRGSSAMISAVPMQNALLMGGYGLGKQWSADNDNEDALMSVFIGGCTGGILQSFLMSPVELMKVNQQVIGKSTKDAAKELIDGLSKRNQSWRGLTATLLRDGIPHGVWFLSYEWSKTFMLKQKENSLVKGNSTSYEQLTVPLTSGAVAATVAWLVSHS